MIEIKKVEAIDQLRNLKKQYLSQTTAPLDGMWLCDFVPLANHFGCYEDDALIGFFCVNDEGYLLQFFVSRNHRPPRLLESIVQGDSPAGEIKGAFASTAEPDWLSLCFDCFSNFEVNALMYQLGRETETQPHENALSMAALTSSQLTEAVNFSVANIDAPEEWLTSYYRNLINRQELFGLWNDQGIIALGESRGREEHQTEYADLGMIIARSERGQGLATQVLKQLVSMNAANGLKSICSTEKTNIAAQKAIQRAGFFANNRIIQFYDPSCDAHSSASQHRSQTNTV